MRGFVASQQNGKPMCRIGFWGNLARQNRLTKSLFRSSFRKAAQCRTSFKTLKKWLYLKCLSAIYMRLNKHFCSGSRLKTAATKSLKTGLF
jgi:hypothetical protein